jgi:hypothetical protein
MIGRMCSIHLLPVRALSTLMFFLLLFRNKEGALFLTNCFSTHCKSKRGWFISVTTTEALNISRNHPCCIVVCPICSTLYSFGGFHLKPKPTYSERMCKVVKVFGSSCRPNESCHTRFLEGKPNANHVRARISYSRTQQLHNMDIITQCSK